MFKWLRHGLGMSPPEQKPELPSELSQVEAILKDLGYDLTPYGAGAALLSLGSGYSFAETASHFASVTLALDAKEAGNDVMALGAMAVHARAMLDVLRRLTELGYVREQLFKNDGRALIMVVTPGPNQRPWIEKILSDPVVGSQRVATSRLPYRQG